MSYQPYSSNASGIVFFGNPSTGPVYNSEASFIYDSSNDRLHTGSVAIDNGSYIGCDGFTDILQLNSDGTASFASGLTVAGDLIIQGTSTTVNTETVTIADNKILLNSDYSGNTPSADAGITVNRGGGTAPDVELIWDEGNDTWKLEYTNGTYYDIKSHILGGEGITTSDADHIRTLNFDISDLSTTITSASDTDFIAIHDGSATKKITRANFISGLGGGTVTSIDVNGGSGIVVREAGPITDNGSFTVDVDVDQATIGVNGSNEIYVNDAGIDTTQLADSSVTEAKISRSVDTSFTNGDTISSDINLVSGGAGGISINLPPPSSGNIVVVKKIDSAAGSVTISQNASETIDGAALKILYYQYETMTFVSDGTNWYII